MRGIGTAGARGGRDSAIDSLRGMLVIAVILGHYSELTDRTGFLTWVGSGVRMPVFMGLAGYLFSLERARATGWLRLLQRYYGRLILPWLAALAVYLTVTQQIWLLAPYHAIIRPPFHFWFVPVLMAFILIAALSRRSPIALLAMAVPISVAAMYTFGVGYTVEQPPAWLPDRRFFIYPVYFFYGLWVAHRQSERWKTVGACLLAPIGILWWCGLYGTPDLTAEVAATLTASLPLICLLPHVRGLPIALPIIAGVGRNSLFFYLWHPMMFGLWSSYGVSGLPMLALTLLSLLVAGRLFAEAPAAARILGMIPRRPGVATPSEAATAGPLAPSGTAT